ncbi:outer membrane protein [Pseudomonas tolaasii]|uniref:outer membrane protein n=1 Tax=Pseudomonas tolaasii TaxID=29442 RepID=UPI00030D9A70|nr:outer membrane protein [Pseudomonas tolaasii]MBW1249442.1 porin family protein [Pseudomonas tolaasii]NWC29508.1 porin family protein [Pseudomonas tolaasii]QXQ20831.1 porin family protein [Pseudomonas tolaasii]
MITRLLALTALTVVASSAVQAADAYSSEGPTDWTGFYGGLSAGYGFGGDDDVNTKGQAAPNIANINGGARPGRVNLDRNGLLGGAQVGYNYQFGQWVAGVEADISHTDLQDSRNIGTAQLNTHLALNNKFESKIKYLGTLRGRFGYAFDHTLIYGTAGLAYGETSQSVDMFGPTGNTQFSGDQSHFKMGYTVGAGIEQSITKNLSFKTEYLYYDLGQDKLNVAVIPGSGGAGTGYDSKFKNDGQMLRVGLNWKFD